MQDIYSAIVGAPPSEQEKIEALARKLRGRQMIGQLGMLTGDKVLAPMGQNIAAETQGQAEKIGGYQARRRELEAQEQMARMNDEAQMARQLQEQGFNAGERALDRALQRELEQLQQAGQDRRATAAETKADAAMKRDLDRYVERYGKERERVGLPDMQSYINTADKVLSKYEGKSLPGIGFMDFTSRTSQAGSEVRQAVQAVQNALLKALSGAAVTQSEADRLEAQMFGPLATEQSFRAGWNSLKAAIAAKEQNIDQSYDPLVVETYRSRAPKASGSAGAAEGEISFEEFKRRRAAGEL